MRCRAAVSVGSALCLSAPSLLLALPGSTLRKNAKKRSNNAGIQSTRKRKRVTRPGLPWVRYAPKLLITDAYSLTVPSVL